MRKKFLSNTKWEAETGYARAVKVNQQIFAAVDDSGNIHAPGNLEAQAVFIFKKIETALQNLGASLNDVVRTRAFITNMDDYQGFSKAHHQFFKTVQPACTLVEVSRLINDDIVIEIEVDAVIA